MSNTYTLYTGREITSENLVGSSMSRGYILGVLEHIFSSMGDGETTTLTILATKEDNIYDYDEKENEKDYICVSDEDEQEDGSDDEEFGGEGAEEATDIEEVEGDRVQEEGE